MQIGEAAGIAGDAEHQRIDLEEPHGVRRPHERGHGAGSKADRAKAGRGLADLHVLEHLGDRSRRSVVGRGRAAEGRVERLGAVKRRAVDHDPHLAEVRSVELAQFDHTEEAAAGLGDVVVVPGLGRRGRQGGKQKRVGGRPVSQEEGRNDHPAEQQDLQRARHLDMGARHQQRAAQPDSHQSGHAMAHRPAPPGPRQAGQRQHQGIFPDAVEQRRSKEGVERAPDHAAEGEEQIELGQPGHRRAALGQGLVAHQRRQEEGAQVQAKQPQPGRGPDRDHQQARRRGRRLKDQGDVERDQRPLLEGDDEGRQIEGQRQHPQERGRGHVCGDVGRHAQQQARRRRGQEDPGQAFPPGPGEGRRLRFRDSGRGLAGQPPGDPD